MQAFGDSITVGVGANPSSKSWMGLYTPINSAVSGAQAADVSNKVIISEVSDKYSLMVGANDVAVYKNDQVKQGYYATFMRHNLAWLSFPNKVFAKDMTMTGNWINTAANSFGKNTTQQGATISTTVIGSKIFIGYIIQSNTVALSRGDVYIDGQLAGMLSCDGLTVSMTTQNGATWGNACEVFHVADGTHTVSIVCTTSGKQLYINYICANQTETPVKISNIIKMSATGYNTYGISIDTTNTYNSILTNVLTDFSAILIDNYSAIDPTLHLADNLHPNNAGHQIIHNNFNYTL